MTDYPYEFLEQYYNENRTKKIHDLPDFILSLSHNVNRLNLINFLSKKEHLNEFDYYIQIFISDKLENLHPFSLELPIYITEMFDIIKIKHNIKKTGHVNSSDVIKLIEYKLQFLNNITEFNEHYMLLWTTMISNFQTFELCYFGCNLKNIQRYISQLRYKYIYKQYQNIYTTSYDLKQIKNENKNKIKIGIVNDFLLEPHVMSKWYLPIFNSLDKNQYELIYITSKSSEDKKNNISHNFDKIIRVLNLYSSLLLNKNGDNTIKLLLNEKFDIIIYPSIGMSILSQLSNIRLAPIQIMFPGHPITSGSKHIDYILLSNYFVKNELEKNLLQESVSEKIIYYESIHMHTEQIKIKQNCVRSDLFMENNIFYITCFQNKWKITNYMKHLIENILNNTPQEIHIILQKNSNIDKNSVTLLLKNKYPDRILLIESQTHQMYLNLIKNSDLILDSYPFNGSTTTLEALTLGKIVIGMDINNDSNTEVYVPSACLNSFYNILKINGLTYKTQKELINAVNALYKNKNEKLRIEELIKKSKFRLNTNLPDFNKLFRHLHLIK